MFIKLNFLKNLLIISAFSLLLFGCANLNKADDPLIIPPNFNEMPNLNEKEITPPKTQDKDIQDLQNLLLQNPS